MPPKDQQEIPIQPPNRPILCGPYDEPTAHWVYGQDSGEAIEMAGRREAGYWYTTERTGSAQMSLLAEEQRDDLPLINALRDDVKRWRALDYEGATQVTKQLLRQWSREDLPRRLFFCQREAVETVIYLTEILGSGRKPRWTPKLSVEDYRRLCGGERPEFMGDVGKTVFPSLVDVPNGDISAPLRRYGCKMATGSGKTVVMAMLIAWAFCNRGAVPGDDRFPAAAIAVCPNLTIKERLQVLRPDHTGNYYEQFDLVPSQLMGHLRRGKVVVTNWHRFLPQSPHAESGKSYAVVDKGDEPPDAFARRVLGALYDQAPVMVLNDEAHHAYRPAPVEERGEKLTKEEKGERAQATVWIEGLDKINQARGVKFCVDLSATPFYLHGSGHIEGSPFPWLVSDFGLVDAIESGIVKIPRIPVSDTTGRPEPRYFALWRHITENLKPGQKLSRGKPHPDVVWREAQDALITLATQWRERFQYVQDGQPGKEHTPPVMIIVCDNTDIAELFFQNISGERMQDVVDENGKGKHGKPKQRRVFGATELPGFAEFQNTEDHRPTLRIDSKLLAEAESEDPNKSRSDVAEELRAKVATVGKRGEAGEQVRCVVSVQMLSEGWDANNVTHILGLRAFGSQLLCEQVVGRGLRRMDYTVDPDTGLLTEEYVDVYGVPFSVIPFRGRAPNKPEPVDRPKNHVRALDERALYGIRFPVVEGYAFALERDMIRADVGRIELLHLDPGKYPTAACVKPQVGYQIGTPSQVGGFDVWEQDREAFYDTYHLQTVKFGIAQHIVTALTEGFQDPKIAPKLRAHSRQRLFPRNYSAPCAAGMNGFARKAS
jgi:type III restriction enzyme